MPRFSALMVDDAAFDHHRCIRQKSAARWIVAQDRFVKCDHRNALRIVLIAHRMANLLRRLGADKRQVIAQQRIRFFTIFFRGSDRRDDLVLLVHSASSSLTDYGFASG